MTMYWVYDLPNWLFGTLCIAASLMSGLLGLLIFLVGTLDNPFRGKVSVTPQPLVRVYDQFMR